MVGLKTFWITISALFLLAACVPQTKQTECRANEAFNASLRTCVPIVGGPSSFITVSNYTPQFTQTRYKDDPTILSFTISVANPYNQSYSVEWERVFNAGPVSMCSNSLTCTTSGSFLGNVLGQIGTHIITAKVKDGNGAVVDSHSFELKINDLPRPVINTATITPASYAMDAFPTDANINFSFTIRNNNATISALDGYKTTWTIVKNGSTILTEVDPFSNFSSSGTNNAYLGTSPTPAFDPNGALFGVGSYIVRAVVSNDSPGEVVDEHQWNVIVKQPDLANVTNIAGPAPGVTITAHHEVDYNDYPTLSWISGSPATQPTYCVTVDDRDGTYPGDGASIQVRWYLDSIGGDICTKTTLDTPGTQTICLIDANPCTGTALPFDTSLLKFSNSSSAITQPHKVTARLFDEATTYEFQRSDVIPSNGSYPIEWNVLVKPVNTAPTMGFGTAATNPTGCISAGANTRSNCAVSQGTNFTVSFTATDDFYSPVADANNFQWDVKLKQNGADIASPPTNTSCSKAFGTAVTVPAASGPYTTQWTCTLAVPHFISSGPLDPNDGPYQVVATMQDSGSPVGGAGLISTSLTWNLVVTETNPSGITLAAQTAINTDSHISESGVARDPASSASTVNEKQTIAFNLNVSDAEVDDFKYRISLCTVNTPTPCTSSTIITSPAYVDYIRSSKADPDLNPTLFSGLLYTIPEDVLLQVSPQQDVNTSTPALVYFKVDVVDAPDVIAGTATSRIFQVYVLNVNPAPVINTATANPAVGTTTSVYAGMPFTIDPGSVTDVGPTSETSILYQWYADVGGGFTAIDGATSRILKYTPGNISTNITLKLCVGDRPAANPVSSTGTCSGTWTIAPKPYLYNLTSTGSGQMRENLAVWYDNFNTIPNTQVIYSAYTDDGLDVYVEKTIKNAAGTITLSTQTIQMEALASGTANSVSNLSITGTAESLYIAYLATPSSAPSTNVPRVRRISKFTAAQGTKSALDHSDRFGFNYTQYTIASGSAGVVFANGDGSGGAATITFNANMLATETVTINGVTFTAVAGAAAGPNDMCIGGTCGSTSASAAFLANKINVSTAAGLHGITATSAGNVVSLHGQYGSDYLDYDGSIGTVPALVSASNGLGKIFVSGSRWHLPFINSSLAGADQNNITLISANADTHLRNVGLVPTNGNDLLEMGKVAAFDSKINAAGELVIAKISAELSDAGAVSIWRYKPNGAIFDLFDETVTGSTTDQHQIDIFGTFSFEYVKLAVNDVGNDYFYVIAKEKTVNGGEFHIGRYSKDLDSAVTPSENDVMTRRDTTDSTSTFITTALMKFPDIVAVPGTTEARIFFTSVGAGATPYPRMARWKSDDTLSCGICASLSGTAATYATAPIGLSQMANNITLGTAGVTASENVKDMVFTLFNSEVSAGNFKPQLGLINVESESIQSTTIDATGRWRPPFAK